MKKTIVTLFFVTFAYPLLADQSNLAQQIEVGRQIAEDRNKGNCLACHFVPGGEMTGTIAPPLIQMKLRYPDKSLLREQIWDARTRNPDSYMPPYGQHSVLTEHELDLVVEYIYSL